jgi:S1-C subfamily serine protease
MAAGGALLHNRAASTSAPPSQVPLIPVNPASPSTGDGSGSAPGTGTSPQAAALAAKVEPGVVDINTKLSLRHATAAGTGMVLSSSGLVLTNNHVIDGATSITATVVDTGRKYNAKVIGTNATDDIAVIQLQNAADLKPIKTGNSGTVSPGDPVVAIGNAGGAGGTPSVVSGTVLATNQTITASDPGGLNAEQLSGLIQINAPLQPGDSGGPLVNGAGEVIGMNTAASTGRRFQSAASVGFAIPIIHAVDVANQIEAGKASSTVRIGLPGILGVSVAAPSATVNQVQPGFPAAASGLAVGDTITSVDGQTVNSSAALHALLFSHHPGDTVTVGWATASGASHSAVMKLATGPAD